MDPKLVDQATNSPGKCLVSRDTEGPFIDTGCYAMHHNPYLYLSVRWVKEIARDLLGMVPAEEVEGQLNAMREAVEEQNQRIAELTRFEEATTEYIEARDELEHVA